MQSTGSVLAASYSEEHTRSYYLTSRTVAILTIGTARGQFYMVNASLFVVSRLQPGQLIYGGVVDNT